MINNKKSKILIGCLALLLVLSVGYAYFSQNITINGTATAKGSFDISYTCQVTGGTGMCNIEGNKITTTSMISKPNENIEYLVTLTNNGTIPAVLKTIDSPNNYGVDENNNFVSPGDYFYLDKATLLYGIYSIYVNDSEFTGDSEVENKKITLQPGDSIELLISHVWADYDGNIDLFNPIGITEQPKLPKEGVTMKYDIVLGFGQIINE